MDEEKNPQVEVFVPKRRFTGLKLLRLQNLSRIGRYVVLAVLVAVLIPVVIIGYRYYSNNVRAYIMIGDVTITKSHYQELIHQAQDDEWTIQNATDKLILVETNIQAAKKSGITFTDDDIAPILSSRFSVRDVSKATEWQKLNAQDAVIDSKVLLAKTGGYQGAVFILPFSRNFDISDISQAGPDFLKPEAIAADKAYAMQKATNFRKKLIDKSLTAAQIVSDIKKDGRLILGSSGNKSKEFNLDINGLDISDTSFIDMSGQAYASQLKSMKAGEVSQILTEKVALSYYPKGETPTPKDAAYYFVYLKAFSKPNPNISNDITTAKKSIKVVRHDR